MSRASSIKRLGRRKSVVPKARRENLRILVQPVVAAFSRPAFWLSLALVANVLEGALRKWVPGFSGGAGRIFAYFSKDIILGIGVVTLLAGRQRRSVALTSLSDWGGIAFAFIGVGALFGLSQGFNATGAALSLRALVILPLFGYLYSGRVTRFPIIGFALVAVFLTAINAPLSLIQSGLPASHILNKYAEDEMIVVEVASGVRATGTFAYLSGPAMVAVLGLWGGMVLLSLGKNRVTQMLGALGVLSASACAFASGSRGALVVVVATLGLWALSSVRASRVLWRSLWLAGILALAVLLVFPSLAGRFVIMGEGVFDRFETAGDSNSRRAFGQFEELLHAVIHHPIGTGLGTEQVGGNYVASGVAGFTQYENQFPRIVAEVGLLGFVGFVLLVIATLLALQETRGDSRYWRWNLVVTATQITLLGQFYGSLVFNHTASAMVWLIATAVLAAAPVTTRRPRWRRSNKRRIRKIEPESSAEELSDTAGGA
ncbi:MAG: O-antigen ligase family protein [Luteolibacter sp.]